MIDLVIFVSEIEHHEIIYADAFFQLAPALNSFIGELVFVIPLIDDHVKSERLCRFFFFIRSPKK